MFGFFKKDPLKKLESAHTAKLEEAMHAQRRGDMRAFALLTDEADTIQQEIETLKQQQKPAHS